MFYKVKLWYPFPRLVVYFLNYRTFSYRCERLRYSFDCGQAANRKYDCDLNPSQNEDWCRLLMIILPGREPHWTTIGTLPPLSTQSAPKLSCSMHDSFHRSLEIPVLGARRGQCMKGFSTQHGLLRLSSRQPEYCSNHNQTTTS